MVGVIAHQCGEIERGGEASLTMRKQVAETLVGVFRGAEAGELSHGPETATVHGGVDSAGVWWFARKAQMLGSIKIRKVCFGV